jgi:hypothetical protein
MSTGAFDLGNEPTIDPPTLTEQQQVLTALGVPDSPLRTFLGFTQNDPPETRLPAAAAAREYLGAQGAIGVLRLNEGTDELIPDYPGTFITPELVNEPALGIRLTPTLQEITVINRSSYSIPFSNGVDLLDIVAVSGSRTTVYYDGFNWRCAASRWALPGGEITVTRASDTTLVLSTTGSDNIERTVTLSFGAAAPPTQAALYISGLSSGAPTIYTNTGFVNYNGNPVELVSASFPDTEQTIYPCDAQGSPNGYMHYLALVGVSAGTVDMDGLSIPYGGGSPEIIDLSYSQLGTVRLANGHAPSVTTGFTTIGSLTLDNFGIGYDLNISAMNLDAAQLDAIFGGLGPPPDVRGQVRPIIHIAGNPGENTCDYSIALGKGYDVYTTDGPITI